MRCSSICIHGKQFYYISYPITELHLKKFHYNLSFIIHLELLYNTVSGRMQSCIFNYVITRTIGGLCYPLTASMQVQILSQRSVKKRNHDINPT